MRRLQRLLCQLLRLPYTEARRLLIDPELETTHRRLRRLELEVLTMGRRSDDHLYD